MLLIVVSIGFDGHPVHYATIILQEAPFQESIIDHDFHPALAAHPGHRCRRRHHINAEQRQPHLHISQERCFDPGMLAAYCPLHHIELSTRIGCHLTAGHDKKYKLHNSLHGFENGLHSAPAIQ